MVLHVVHVFVGSGVKVPGCFMVLDSDCVGSWVVGILMRAHLASIDEPVFLVQVVHECSRMCVSVNRILCGCVVFSRICMSSSRHSVGEDWISGLSVTWNVSFMYCMSCLIWVFSVGVSSSVDLVMCFMICRSGSGSEGYVSMCMNSGCSASIAALI